MPKDEGRGDPAQGAAGLLPPAAVRGCVSGAHAFGARVRGRSMAQSRRGSEQVHGLSKKRSVRSGWPLEGTTRKPALVGDRDGQVRGRHGPLEGTLAARAHAWQKAPRPQSHSPTREGRAPSERGAGCGTLVVTADRSLGHSTGFPGPRLPVPTAPRSVPGAHTHSPRCAGHRHRRRSGPTAHR